MPICSTNKKSGGLTLPLALWVELISQNFSLFSCEFFAVFRSGGVLLPPNLAEAKPTETRGVSAWVLFPLLILALFFSVFLCVFEWCFVLPSVAVSGGLWWRSPAPAVFLYGFSLRRSWARSGRFCVVCRPAPRPADKEKSPAARLPPLVVSKCALRVLCCPVNFSRLLAFWSSWYLYTCWGRLRHFCPKYTLVFSMFFRCQCSAPLSVFVHDA